MSNMEDNEVFVPLTGGLPESGFKHWLFMEEKFGEFGEPGFSKLKSLMTNPTLFGHNSQVEVFYTFLRDQDGLLVCVHCQYYDENGIRKPYFIMTHPDHRGKGVGTQMALHLEEEFIETRAHVYGYTTEEFRNMTRSERAALAIPKMYEGVTTSNSGAGFINNMVNKMMSNENDVA
jgi:GNAT superfamily N-acetyltransferase